MKEFGHGPTLPVMSDWYKHEADQVYPLYQVLSITMNTYIVILLTLYDLTIYNDSSASPIFPRLQ